MNVGEVLYVVSLSTESNVGATATRAPSPAVVGSTPAQLRIVAMNDVWSKS